MATGEDGSRAGGHWGDSPESSLYTGGARDGTGGRGAPAARSWESGRPKLCCCTPAPVAAAAWEEMSLTLIAAFQRLVAAGNREVSISTEALRFCSQHSD